MCRYPYVEIGPEDYQIAEEAAKNMWCHSKKGFYGKGILNSAKDPYKTERIGKLGEMAFSKKFGYPMNNEYVKGGTAHDFTMKNGATIDVKTAAFYPDYKAGLIYAANAAGELVKLKSDIYVFFFLLQELKKEKTACVAMVGFCTKFFALQQELSPAIRGNHYNYMLAYDKLTPMEKFCEN